MSASLDSWASSFRNKSAVPLLVLCFQEPELTLKRISASALSDICKHSPELAQTVVDAGAVSLLAKDISHNDAPLKRQVCSCLAQIAKHSVDLAEVVVEAEIFPRILHCLKDIDEFVRKNAATCIREIARHTPDLAKLIVNAGGVAAMVDYITEARGNNRLPGIMTLGYIAAFSETLALAVVVSKGIPPLKDALINEPEDHLKAASAWSLGQLGPRVLLLVIARLGESSANGLIIRLCLGCIPGIRRLIAFILIELIPGGTIMLQSCTNAFFTVGPWCVPSIAIPAEIRKTWWWHAFASP
eukprot:s4489_g6.t1